MIFDSLKYLGFYLKNQNALEKIQAFISSLDENTPEKKYEICGKEVFAIVSSYQTRHATDGVLETHHKYIDLQMLIKGQEEVLVCPAADQKLEVTYDADRDVEFYRKDLPKEVKFTLNPGCFALLFPQDAHMPCICIDGKPAGVKKCVIKIDASLF